MARGKSVDERRPITPKHVFDRTNMPSRWERLTAVAPKIFEDKVFLSFVAARYLGEELLPHPATLVAPDELRRQKSANLIGARVCAGAGALAVIGVIVPWPFLILIAVLVAIGALLAMRKVSTSTAPAIREFNARKARSEYALARLHSEFLDPDYRSTLSTMIACDEGRLAYCAAKIASEIERSGHGRAPSVEIAAIDLWDELCAVGASAREISEDREETERLEQSRLRDTPAVRETIASDNALRDAAIARLAARVHAFADYRDRVQLLGSAAWRESRIASRTTRLTSDELATNELLRGPHVEPQSPKFDKFGFKP